MEEQPTKPFHEFVIAIAGPAVNLVLAIICGVVVRLTLTKEDALASINGLGGDSPATWQNLLFLAFLTNVTMFVFNLIPAFPLDGGRILRAFTWRFLGFYLGTVVAVWVSRVIAVAGIAWAVTHSQPFIAVIALLLLVGGYAELKNHDQLLKIKD